MNRTQAFEFPSHFPASTLIAYYIKKPFADQAEITIEYLVQSWRSIFVALYEIKLAKLKVFSITFEKSLSFQELFIQLNSFLVMLFPQSFSNI